MKKILNKKTLIIVGVLVILAVAAYLFLPQLLASSSSSQTTTTYQTQPAALGDLVAVVGASGNVRTSQSAVLNWQISGQVAIINVAKGDLVIKDQVLTELDMTSVSSSIINAQVDLQAAKDSLNSLLNSGTARANAQLALATAEQAVVTAQKARQSKLFQRASQQTIDISQANLIVAQDALDKAETMYSQNSTRSRQDTVYANALSELATAQQSATKAQYNLAYVQGLPSPLDIATADANLALAKAQLLDAETAWNRVKDGPNESDVIAVQAKVTVAQATLDQVRIKAPFDGTITQINSKPGDLVSAGTQAFQIDDMSTLYVDVSVSEIDINRVQLGQTATLSFDAVPGKEFNGVVSDIATTGVITSGAVNYTVTLQMTDSSPEIKPGMTAAASITTVQLTGVLTVPNQAIRTVSGNQVVYVLRNNTNARPVEVVLGASNDTDSEVLQSNLQVGDLIILNPPDSTTGGGFGPGGMGGGGGGIRIPGD